jgi:hypothetical protein
MVTVVDVVVMVAVVVVVGMVAILVDLLASAFCINMSQLMHGTRISVSFLFEIQAT